MAARPIDSLGGIGYGKWKMAAIGALPSGTPALAATDVFPAVTVAGVTYPGLLITETGILRVIVAENTGVAFSLNLTHLFGTPTATTTLMAYNAGAALAANSLYLFDCPVDTGDVVNFQFAGLTTILELKVGMVIMMGP